MLERNKVRTTSFVGLAEHLARTKAALDEREQSLNLRERKMRYEDGLVIYALLYVAGGEVRVPLMSG